VVEASAGRSERQRRSPRPADARHARVRVFFGRSEAATLPPACQRGFHHVDPRPCCPDCLPATRSARGRTL